MTVAVALTVVLLPVVSVPKVDPVMPVAAPVMVAPVRVVDAEAPPARLRDVVPALTSTVFKVVFGLVPVVVRPVADGSNRTLLIDAMPPLFVMSEVVWV